MTTRRAFPPVLSGYQVAAGSPGGLKCRLAPSGISISACSKSRPVSRSGLSNSAFDQHWLPNRSLSPVGRLLWLGLICIPVTVIAVAFALLGAWWVVPFAGLEIVLLVWAFRNIARGDRDFERITVGQGLWEYEACIQGLGMRSKGSLAWLRVEERMALGRLEVGLRYSGRLIVIGRLLPEDGRRGLARRLKVAVRGAR